MYAAAVCSLVMGSRKALRLSNQACATKKSANEAIRWRPADDGPRQEIAIEDGTVDGQELGKRNIDTLEPKIRSYPIHQSLDLSTYEDIGDSRKVLDGANATPWEVSMIRL